MSRIKSKLVLKTTLQGNFQIAKSVNTLEHGKPGDTLTRKEVDRILIDFKPRMLRGELTIEFIGR